MIKQRLDHALVLRGLVPTRSQAENYIRMGYVTVNGKRIEKAGFDVADSTVIALNINEQYVSRAGHKMASVSSQLKLDFRDKIVLDVGSSTGGFTDFALKHGARKVIAVELGTDQLHASLHNNPKIELHEKTDIRTFATNHSIEIAVVDVSFVSLRDILPAVFKLSNNSTQVLAMAKPQFEAQASGLKHKGVIKNDRMRRDILQAFEQWVKQIAIVVDKADSEVAGSKGNIERFYLLKKINT